MAGATNDLLKASDAIAAGVTAGNAYVDKVEGIRDELVAIDSNTTGASDLGTMIGAQLRLTSAETEFQVKSSLPNKIIKSINSAAGDVKQAANK